MKNNPRTPQPAIPTLPPAAGSSGGPLIIKGPCKITFAGGTFTGGDVVITKKTPHDDELAFSE